MPSGQWFTGFFIFCSNAGNGFEDKVLVYKCGQKKWNNLYYQIYDRSIVASVNGISIHTELEKNALEKVLKSEKARKGLILHSNQGCQFTS